MSKFFRKVDYGNGVKYWYLGDWKFAKKNGNCFYLLGRKKEDHYEGRELYAGWKDWKFEISYDECGYESPNSELNISILGWYSVFKLPFKSKRFPYGDCDAPKWGIAIHNNTFWVYKGGDGNMNGGSKWWTWDIPYFTLNHVRHDVECVVDGEVVMVPYDELVDHKHNYVPLNSNELVNKYHYVYTDKYDGAKIDTTYWVEEREWRPKWFEWCDRFKTIRRYIEIDFKEEVGSRKGSWKGGVLGCSYNLLPGESPEDCIKRMERNKEF